MEWQVFSVHCQHKQNCVAFYRPVNLTGRCMLLHVQSRPSDTQRHLSHSKHTIRKEHQNMPKFFFKYGMTLCMEACMGDTKGVHRVVVKWTGGKRQLGRPRRRWEDNIKKWIFKKRDGGMYWIELVKDRNRVLWIRKWKFGFHKMWGISWIPSQEGLCSI